MLAAVKGIIQGNTVIIEEDIQEYDDTEVVVTLLEYSKEKTQKETSDWDRYVIPNSERGKMLMNI